MKNAPTIEDVRKARQQISRECGYDARRLVDYYQRLQSEERESTPAKVVKARRDAQVGRQKLRFFVKSDCAASAVQQAPRAFAPMKVSTPETTAFDLVRYAPRLGGIDRTAETLAPMLHLLQPARLKSVLVAEDEVSTMQRLGFVLETMGQVKLAAAVETCLPSRCVWIPLAVGATCPAGAPRHQRWHVVENAAITTWN